MKKDLPKSRLNLDKPNVVGTFHSNKKKIDANKLEGIDAIELRLDLLESLPPLEELNKLPLIMTARHSEEGGNRNLNNTRRLELLRESIPLAAFIDLELQFLDESVLQLARESGVGVIASYHDFSGTPPLSELVEKVHSAQQIGVDVFKVATYLNGPADLANLLQLFTPISTHLSIMGMGPLGMASRLLLARCGSVLNYGWLGSPLVAGQWPAEKFAEVLKILLNS